MSKLERSSQVVAQQAEIGLGEERLMEGGIGNVEENGFISSCHATCILSFCSFTNISKIAVSSTYGHQILLDYPKMQ